MLPEPIRTELSAAMTAQQFDLDDTAYNDLPDLISSSITWQLTPQGFPYWANVHKRALTGDFGAKQEPEPERVIPKGTRVRNLQHDDVCVKFGATGTVDQDSSTPWVVWDSPDMLTEYGQCDNRRWAQDSKYLEIISEPEPETINHPLSGIIDAADRNVKLVRKVADAVASMRDHLPVGPDGTPVWRELSGDEWNDIAIVMMSRGLAFGVEALNKKLKQILSEPAK